MPQEGLGNIWGMRPDDFTKPQPRHRKLNSPIGMQTNKRNSLRLNLAIKRVARWLGRGSDRDDSNGVVIAMQKRCELHATTLRTAHLQFRDDQIDLQFVACSWVEIAKLRKGKLGKLRCPWVGNLVMSPMETNPLSLYVSSLY
jgi:hypothetical protein